MRLMNALLPILRCLSQSNVAALPAEAGESDLEVSEEDVRFVDEYSQRLGFLTNLNKEKIDKYGLYLSQVKQCK